jgi:IS605 OrfB family transposase
MVLGDFQLQYFRDKSWKIRESEIVYSNHKYFLHLTVQREEPEQATADMPVGVDLGINRIATSSNKVKFKIKNLKSVRNHYLKVKASIQSKGTRGAKRLLRRLSGKERRLCKNINHIISKQLVDSLNVGEYLVFENLKGIRQRVRLAKKQRRNLHSWSFGQLIDFSTYKALAKGIPVVFEDAKNSSRECSRCGHISKANRKSQALFRCVKCGFQHNADSNSSFVLAKRAGSIGLGYSQLAPEVSALRLETSPLTLVRGS